MLNRYDFVYLLMSYNIDLRKEDKTSLRDRGFFLMHFSIRTTLSTPLIYYLFTYM